MQGRLFKVTRLKQDASGITSLGHRPARCSQMFSCATRLVKKSQALESVKRLRIKKTARGGRSVSTKSSSFLINWEFFLPLARIARLFRRVAGGRKTRIVARKPARRHRRNHVFIESSLTSPEYSVGPGGKKAAFGIKSLLFRPNSVPRFTFQRHGASALKAPLLVRKKNWLLCRRWAEVTGVKAR